MVRQFVLSALLALVGLPALASAQGFSPEDAAKRMKLPEGFSARVVAAEPMIRQPVSISFDSRGRMWVLQYLQYPNYAGLKPVKQDQYLRTIWDKFPEPPPLGPKGADRLTICYDPDETGAFRKSKDFVTGLNIASGFCLGSGGVYVAQPPYLLFYPDKNEDDVPDGDPEVLLTGFGMDDTHSLANSLQWGPDGWLYGAAGSTSTCKIKNPADPSSAPIEFQQGIWRYHPNSRRFELFSEGGGNTYGLDFDKNGQIIAGTNYGGFACLHQMQGAYYVKGFSKHGPLHNPHTYGYFEHIPYTGFKGGHVTCGGIVYQGDAYPPEYRDQYIAANVLSNAIYWHKLEPVSSSFKARHGGELLEANDTWFRPIDLLQGPDGSVYVVDFYDRRAAHLDPVDTWDRTNGRVYKIEYKGTPRVPPFDLHKKTSVELVELLKHPNVWWRRAARELLTERRDESTYPTLRKWLLTENGTLSLEAFWALYTSGGWVERDFDHVGTHPNEYVRAWAVRVLGDDGEPLSEITFGALGRLAATESSPVVMAQLACSAKRLSPAVSMQLVERMFENPLCSQDPQLPLLLWWVMESANTRDKTDQVRFRYPTPPNDPLRDKFGEWIARRLMSGDIVRGAERTVTVFQLAAGAGADVAPVLRGVATALQAHPLDAVPPPLMPILEGLRAAKPKELLVLEVLARMNDARARAALREIAADGAAVDATRLKAIDLLRQVREPQARTGFLDLLKGPGSDALKVGLLSGLEVFDGPEIAEAVFAAYPSWSPVVRKRAVQLLISRPAWATALLRRVEKGLFPRSDLTVDHAKAAIGLGDAALTGLVETQFGKLSAATAGEKQARIAWLNVALSRNGPGDSARGKGLFTKHCAACHILHGEGGKVGPDLTTADRKNRGYMLAQVVDPSGYIRPEYVVQSVVTLDGRKLSGIVEPSIGESLTLVNVVNNQPQKTVVAKADIETITPSPISLMPEKLLDTLTETEVGDLFAYLASDPPKPASKPLTPVTVAGKKLKLCLVSGSFEYKSDESLIGLQKYLEANYPVECTRAFAKAEKDKAFAGLEALDMADAAIFFTRRLQIEGDDLTRVKKFAASGKPIVGIRTASHGFQNWLEMDGLVFGGNYKGHFGQGIPCEVTVEAKAKDHPVVRGVGSFKTAGGLYKNPNVATDVTVLLHGGIPGQTEPVAWVREKGDQRVFYTSLGHPDDFRDPNFLRLVVNALAWTTRAEWPPAK